MITKVTVMNKILEQALLYDFYGELLTTHQKEVYEQFILERSEEHTSELQSR